MSEKGTRNFSCPTSIISLTHNCCDQFSLTPAPNHLPPRVLCHSSSYSDGTSSAFISCTWHPTHFPHVAPSPPSDLSGVDSHAICLISLTMVWAYGVARGLGWRLSWFKWRDRSVCFAWSKQCPPAGGCSVAQRLGNHCMLMYTRWWDRGSADLARVWEVDVGD